MEQLKEKQEKLKFDVEEKLLEYKLAKLEKEHKSNEKTMWRVGKYEPKVNMSLEIRPKSIDNTPLAGESHRQQSLSIPRIAKRLNKN